MYRLLRPLLFLLPPETAHYFSLKSLNILHKLKLMPLFFKQVPNIPYEIMGLKFPNPIGLAAGLDKNGEYIDALASLGFGFIEIGTVTPRPQQGNPRPRLFRLPKTQALINRMGFNNQGVEQLLLNIQKSKFKGILGINIGKNFDTPLEKAVEDYSICLKKVYPYASYVVVNISSPNTPGLRELQHKNQLDILLKHLKQVQQQLATQHQKYVPLVIKIAPDLTPENVAEIAHKLLDYKIDGVIATNTTLSRLGVEKYIDEIGGLSGVPLLKKSTEIVQQLSTILQDKIPIIANGGIKNVNDVQTKIQAGASLVQIYTGIIYQGPKLIQKIVTELKSTS
ncbi:MAG: quinone-dependent dihydroorotate dehydrogenase [Thiomargarita sp.]|nr:quinone-dependent dihydroorotate dehydrogenase [Thiomargarita sp.]